MGPEFERRFGRHRRSAAAESSRRGQNQRAGEIRGALELGLAPRNGEVVIQQHAAHAVDDNMRLTPAVRALESHKIVDLRIGVDVGRECPGICPASVLSDLFREPDFPQNRLLTG